MWQLLNFAFFDGHETNVVLIAGFAAVIIYTALIIGLVSLWFKKKMPGNKKKGFVYPPDKMNATDTTISKDSKLIIMNKICVVGAGFIGSSFCALFLANGCKVTCSDPMVDFDTIKRRITEVWPWLVARGLTTLTNPPFDSLIWCGANLEVAIEGADMVQECAFEEVSHKQALLAKLDGLVGTSIIIASSTSFIPWHLLVTNCVHKHRVLIGHPAIPHMDNFMEVYGSSPEWAQHAKKCYAGQGFDVIIMNKTIPGHVLNSFLRVNQQHGMKLVRDEMCTPEDINTVLRTLGRFLYAQHFFVSCLSTIGGDRGLNGGIKFHERIKKNAISITVFSLLRALWVPNAVASLVSKAMSNMLCNYVERPIPASILEACRSYESKITKGGKVDVQIGIFRASEEMHKRIPKELGNDPFQIN